MHGMFAYICHRNQPNVGKIYGGFLKWYPKIIHLNRGFHYFHHPFWGTTVLGNHHIPYMDGLGDAFCCLIRVNFAPLASGFSGPAGRLIPSMYGIFPYIWFVFNGTIWFSCRYMKYTEYTIHGFGQPPEKLKIFPATGTYKSSFCLKETGLNQTSIIMWNMLIIRGVSHGWNKETDNECWDVKEFQLNSVGCFLKWIMWNTLIFRVPLSKEYNMFELPMNQSFQLLSH